MKNLRKIFLPRLTQRITLWIFASILGIEAAIVVPAIVQQRQKLLGDIVTHSDAVLATLQQSAIASNQTEATLIDVLKQLQTAHLIQGATLYRLDAKRPIAVIGERSQLNIQPPNTDRQTLAIDQRYEVGHTLALPQQSYILVLRHDTTAVNQAIYGDVGRIGGLVLVISAVVAGSLAIVLQYQIIRPIVLLRWDLLQAGETVTQGLVAPEFVSDHYGYQDEFADVITAFQQMFQQISNEIGARKRSESAMRQTTAQLQQTLQELQSTQAQLVQSEKMSSLGQLVAGVAHEINNPMNFIHGNLEYVGHMSQELLAVIQQYQTDYPQMTPAIARQIESVDLDFVRQDLPKLLQSMQDGAQRIQGLVLSFRNFSRLDESEWKTADLHTGLDSTLMLIQHRLQESPSQSAIQIIKQYEDLPKITCCPAQINQAFLALLHNAIDALAPHRSHDNVIYRSNEDQPMIEIKTRIVGESITIDITDNGIGMDEKTLKRAFDPFFTTKDVGAGQGLGLAIGYQIIVDSHGGELFCQSVVNRGTRFTIHLPVGSTIASPN
jgi:signal transduction histidine kinase